MPVAAEDPLTRLQKKMDELGVMFYTFVGVMQRDAPPVARGPDESELEAADNAKRAELAENAPKYAKEIVKTSKEIDELINEVELLIQGNEEADIQWIKSEDEKSRQVGKELAETASSTEKLLAKVRSGLKEIEKEEDRPC